jgi:parvulin-like peptidyl-prolyl isomerase
MRLFIFMALSAIPPVLMAQVSSHALRQPTVNAAYKPVGKPVARVNGTVLTDRDLLREEFTIFPYAKQHNGQLPAAMEPQIRKGAMKMIEFEELIYQEAVRRKLTIAPSKLDKAAADFKKQFSTEAEFQAFLKTELNGSADLMRAKIKRSLLIEQMLKTEVNDKAVVTAADVRAYYDKHPEKFGTPEAFEFQSISFLPPANPTPAQLKEARKRAEAALKLAKATKTYDEFGVLAEKVSEDDFRVMMGDHKKADRSKLPPEIVQVLEKLQPGAVSELVPIDKGFTILRLKGHVQPGKQRFEAVKTGLRAQLEKDKAEELRSGLDKKLRATAKIEEL